MFRERERDACLNGVGTYLPGTVGQGCRLFNRCHNLPPALWGRGAGCLSGVGTVSRALWGRGAGLSGVRTYLLGTVGQGCRLFKWCQNLPPRELLGRCACCLSGVRTYLLGTVGQ